jgi:hypothetical protein
MRPQARPEAAPRVSTGRLGGLLKVTLSEAPVPRGGVEAPRPARGREHVEWPLNQLGAVSMSNDPEGG